MREALYLRRYESAENDRDRREFAPSHVGYKDSLTELYLRILKFQATSVCYYSRNSAVRIGSDMLKWDDWDVMLMDIQSQESEFEVINNLWKDTKYEADSLAVKDRHRQHMNSLLNIEGDISDINKCDF